MPGAKALRGVSTGPALLAIAVIVAFGGIIALLARAIHESDAPSEDASRMRLAFSAWFLYLNDSDGVPAPNLYAIRYRLTGDSVLTSPSDPFVKVPGPYPMEPNLPELPENSPFRISFAYLFNFVRAGKADVPMVRATVDNPRIGILASVWSGEVTPQTDFRAQVKGPIVRVYTDGHVDRTDRDPTATGMGTPRTLFGIP